MAVIPLAQPYTLDAATFAVAADDFTAAVSGVTFTPTTTATTWRGIGGNVVGGVTTPTWAVTLGYAQDLAVGGLSRYLHENAGAKRSVTFTPTDGGPDVTATVTLVPGPIGGTADGNVTTGTVTLPVDGKPAFSA